MKYFVRSIKYFFTLCLLCAAIMVLMLATGTSALDWEQTRYAVLHTDRYAILVGAIVVLAALYPRFGFVRRSIEGDLRLHREQIVDAFRSAGFSLHADEGDRLVFRADGLPRKLLLLGEDEITVTGEGGVLRIDGIRRGVARVVYRLEAYIERTKNE